MKMPTTKTVLSVASSFLVTLFGPAAGSSAATIFAASASRADVGTAVAAAAPGDTVSVPAGSVTWSTELNITKSIKLQGAGAGTTIIKSGVTPGYFSFILNYAPGNRASDPAFTLTGFTFDGNWNSGCVSLLRGSYPDPVYLTKIRIHHNTFTNCGNSSFPGRAVISDGLTFGVIDHNTFLNNQKTFDEEGSDNMGWTIPPQLGGPNYMYFEDNTVSNNRTGVSLITSGGQGGRYVIRYNSFNTTSANADNQHFDIHGTLSDRGTVAAEIYNNTLTTKTGAWQFLDHRGGTAIVFNNRVIKPASDITIQLREEDTGIYPLLDQVTNSYYWNNTYGPMTGLENPITPAVGQGAAYILLNRDYFLPAKGLEADRPATCASGAVYATTDSGKIYRCTVPNNWSLHYQPYAYPHPLTTGETPPARPINLRITP